MENLSLENPSPKVSIPGLGRPPVSLESPERLGSVAGLEAAELTLSVLIPSYNRADLLSVTLEFLAAQEGFEPTRLQVVVVDDGSTDHTAEVVRAFEDRLSIDYLFRPRRLDAQPCPAAVRNFGIPTCRGDVVLFLDTGLAFPRGFLAEVAGLYAEESRQILTFPVLGLYTEPDAENMARLDGLSPETVEPILEELSEEAEWADVRSSVFERVEGDLERLRAPWALCWGFAQAVPRTLVERAGGYDESFTGWGAEDTDFLCRIYMEGAPCRLARGGTILHVPHPKGDGAAQHASDFRNRKKLHRKLYRLETEVYPYLRGSHLNFFLDQWESLTLRDFFAGPSPELAEGLRREHLGDAERLLVSGVENRRFLEQLSPSHVFAHNRATWKRIRKQLPEVESAYLLGCDSPFEDDFFDASLIFDVFRILPRALLKDFLEEHRRISKKTFLALSEADAYARAGLGLEWRGLAELEATAFASGLTLEAVAEGEALQVFSLIEREG